MKLEGTTARLVRQVAVRIRALDLGHPTRIGVDGFCAAGKTTVANALASDLSESGVEVIRVSTDDFQNPPEIRWQLGGTSPDGFYLHAVDFGAVVREVLVPLGPGGSKLYRTSTYDIFALRPNVSQQLAAPDGAVVVLDGLFLHTEPIIHALDYTIFVDAPLDVCVGRACARDQEGKGDGVEIERLYLTRYVPGFERYISECHPREAASCTIWNG